MHIKHARTMQKKKCFPVRFFVLKASYQSDALTGIKPYKSRFFPFPLRYCKIRQGKLETYYSPLNSLNIFLAVPQIRERLNTALTKIRFSDV